MTPISSVSATATTTSQVPTGTSSPTASSKYVIAHFMVGNAYPYTVDNWLADVFLAHSSGIDGFALNVGVDDWQPSQVANAYQAALQSGTGFKLFLSFDMSSLPCSTAANAATLRTYITTYAAHPNQLLYNGRVFASTFSGETCTFGQGSVASGWSTQFVQQLTGSSAVHFVPSFFIDPSQFNTYSSVIDGMFNWNSAWPTQVTTSFVSSLGLLGDIATGQSSAVSSALSGVIGSTTPDDTYISSLTAMGGGRTYMASVSPWFFTHYGPSSYNKNWMYFGDEHLYATRWESLINIRDQVDIVEIISWNDFGESHYIGPIEGDQPMSQAWVDGNDHTGWLNLTSYYASAFKTGTYPTLTKDQLVMWSRPHPAAASASNDPVGKPTNYQITQDKVWAVVLATSPATVVLSTSSTQSQTFNVSAGVSKLSVSIQPGGTMHGTLTRGGQTVIDLQATNFTFEAEPTTYNFNAHVVASP
ncbi:glycoside hydrolase family 71 protein [Suillus paluster]|uniref:glycoside hydrolase family 71 protein n=1 Tax=Suillus paluster TaxID=48578 RepID=UPI001B881C1E|nr:glycoside hydrolase family 71 protein [Suillus paluster]KAG1742365.1 glycoside hydrolase family 71 protein [Suillus paluster]